LLHCLLDKGLNSSRDRINSSRNPYVSSCSESLRYSVQYLQARDSSTAVQQIFELHLYRHTYPDRYIYIHIDQKHDGENICRSVGQICGTCSRIVIRIGIAVPIRSHRANHIHTSVEKHVKVHVHVHVHGNVNVNAKEANRRDGSAILAMRQGARIIVREHASRFCPNQMDQLIVHDHGRFSTTSRRASSLVSQ